MISMNNYYFYELYRPDGENILFCYNYIAIKVFILFYLFSVLIILFKPRIAFQGSCIKTTMQNANNN